MAGHMTGSAAIGGMMAPLMYFLGNWSSTCLGYHVKEDKTIFRQTGSFGNGAPAYHIPSAKTVLLHVWERLKGFIIKAGTILFLACSNVGVINLWL